jgi:hypothetical protein
MSSEHTGDYLPADHAERSAAIEQKLSDELAALAGRIAAAKKPHHLPALYLSGSATCHGCGKTITPNTDAHIIIVAPPDEHGTMPVRIYHVRCYEHSSRTDTALRGAIAAAKALEAPYCPHCHGRMTADITTGVWRCFKCAPCTSPFEAQRELGFALGFE